MKKITKILLTLSLALVMFLSSVPITAFAAEGENRISPRWSHFSNVNFEFVATSSGGYVDISYFGYSDSFARADVHVKLQKRFLLVFWTDVDEWSVSSTDYEDILYHCFTLDGSGTYKATLTFTVTGTDGTVDTVTDSIESRYSN